MTLEHVAFIMDGNRRYSKTFNFAKERGYKEGLEKMTEMMKLQVKYKLKETSFFALSSDNYGKRSSEELKIIFELVEKFCKNDRIISFLKENKIKINIVGKIIEVEERFSLKKSLEHLKKINEEIGEENFIVNIFVNYDGQEEILDAINQILKKGYDEVDDDILKRHMYYKGDPPQVIVRTGNAPRISGFMLWDSKYSEIYLTDKMWPQICEKDFLDILDWYKNIKRNFGK